MDDAQFEELKALILPISNWVAVQTGQAAAQGPTTRSIIAAQAGSQALMAIPAGVDNPGPYRVYRMNVPALPDDVDPDGEAIWQVIGMKGRPIGAPTSRADAEAKITELNVPAEGATVAGSAPPGPANPGPYTHHWSLADLWHVRGKNGTPTGFTGNEPDAKAEADRLNSAESPHHDGPGVNEASLPVTPEPPTPVETNVGTLPAPAAPSR